MQDSNDASHRFEAHDIGRPMDKQLEKGPRVGKEKSPQQNKNLKPTTATNQQKAPSFLIRLAPGTRSLTRLKTIFFSSRFGFEIDGHEH
jgi:hypothetical protein